MASSSPSQPDTRSLRKVRFDSLEPIRAIYRRATKAFVLNQHGQVWTAIHDGLARIAGLLLPRPPPAQPPCWLAPADARHPPSIDSTLDHELLQLERKFLILKITFLAALSQAHPAQRPPSFSADLSADQAGLLAPFLQLADHPHQLLLRLIADICPAPRLHQIHPSILAAIGLASIKLSVPQTGKDLIQAWFAAIEPFHLTFTSPSSNSPTSDLKLSYQNLIQIYAIHILGALSQWQLAADFIHSHLSADILPPETVDTLLEALKTAQAHQAQASKHTLHRLHQRREEASRQQQQQQQQQVSGGRRAPKPEASRAKYSSGSSAGMSTATTASTTTTATTATDGGPPSPRSADRRPSLGSPSSPGYAGFRTRLSRFVAADPGASAPGCPRRAALPPPAPPHPPAHRLKLLLAALLRSPAVAAPSSLLLLCLFFLRPRLPIASASPSAAAAALKAFVSRLLALLKILVTHLP